MSSGSRSKKASKKKKGDTVNESAPLWGTKDVVTKNDSKSSSTTTGKSSRSRSDTAVGDSAPSRKTKAKGKDTAEKKKKDKKKVSTPKDGKAKKRPTRSPPKPPTTKSPPKPPTTNSPARKAPKPPKKKGDPAEKKKDKVKKKKVPTSKDGKAKKPPTRSPPKPPITSPPTRKAPKPPKKKEDPERFVTKHDGTEPFEDYPGFSVMYDENEFPFFQTAVLDVLDVIRLVEVGRKLLEEIANATPTGGKPKKPDKPFSNGINCIFLPTKIKLATPGGKCDKSLSAGSGMKGKKKEKYWSNKEKGVTSFVNFNNSYMIGKDSPHIAIVTAHELIHAYHMVIGEIPALSKRMTKKERTRQEEERTVGLSFYKSEYYSENTFREEFTEDTDFDFKRRDKY